MSWIILFIASWTVASVCYVFANLGNKHSSFDPWYIRVLGLPALIIATIIGKLHKK